jgi:hypothetical protein
LGRFRTPARLAQAAAEKEQAHIKLDMSRRELGEPKKCRKAMEREARPSATCRPDSRVCRRKWMQQDRVQRRSRRMRSP